MRSLIHEYSLSNNIASMTALRHQATPKYVLQNLTLELGSPFASAASKNAVTDLVAFSSFSSRHCKDGHLSSARSSEITIPRVASRGDENAVKAASLSPQMPSSSSTTAEHESSSVYSYVTRGTRETIAGSVCQKRLSVLLAYAIREHTMTCREFAPLLFCSVAKWVYSSRSTATGNPRSSRNRIPKSHEQEMME